MSALPDITVKVSLLDTDLFTELVAHADALLLTARAAVREHEISEAKYAPFRTMGGKSPAMFELNKAIEDFDEWRERNKPED